MRTSRDTSRDRVEASVLVSSARSIWRWLPLPASTAMTRHIAMLNPCAASASSPNWSAMMVPTRFTR